MPEKDHNMPLHEITGIYWHVYPWNYLRFEKGSVCVLLLIIISTAVVPKRRGI